MTKILVTTMQTYLAWWTTNALLKNHFCVKVDGSKPALHSSGDKCVDQVWHVYSNNADFDNDNTVLINVDTHTADQLSLKSSGITCRFLWVPETYLGTVVKIDTDTGLIVGRYRVWPDRFRVGGGVPVGVSVDMDGSVWVANHEDYNYQHGTITHIGPEENGQCEDWNGNRKIETSTGMNDLKAWASDTGTRGVATANDECIVHFVNVTSTWTTQISVNQENDVWVAGAHRQNFDLIKGGHYDVASSGTITITYPTVGWGGYSGFVDGDGVVWSVPFDNGYGLMRWDPVFPLNGTNGAPGGLNVGPPSPGKTWAGNNDTYNYGL